MAKVGAILSLVLVQAAFAAADEGLEFQYTIERERAGAVSEASFLKGFDTQDSLRLRVKLNQASYCYLIMSEANGRFRLAFPEREGQRPAALEPNHWARVPKSTFMRIGNDPGVERMYLVISSESVPELDAAFGRADAVVNEALAIDVRDRYHGDGSYSRDLTGNTISVKYHARGSRPAVVVEEISLRARD